MNCLVSEKENDAKLIRFEPKIIYNWKLHDGAKNYLVTFDKVWHKVINDCLC
jgi:hypothetical protein